MTQSRSSGCEKKNKIGPLDLHQGNWMARNFPTRDCFHDLALKTERRGQVGQDELAASLEMGCILYREAKYN